MQTANERERWDSGEIFKWVKVATDLVQTERDPGTNEHVKQVKCAFVFVFQWHIGATSQCTQRIPAAVGTSNLSRSCDCVLFTYSRTTARFYHVDYYKSILLLKQLLPMRNF